LESLHEALERAAQTDLPERREQLLGWQQGVVSARAEIDDCLDLLGPVGEIRTQP
jgi:hypothetical protein